jgi:hypothetical protein
MPDIAFNLLMLAVDAAALVLVRRRAGWLGVLCGALLAVSACAALALVFALSLRVHPLFAAMRYFAWGVFLHGPLLLLGGALLLRRRRGWRLGLCAAGLGVLAIGAEAFVREPTALGVTRLTLESAKLDRPLRIGLIADLQTDAPGDYELRALRALMAERPDVILFAGDYVHELDRAQRRRDWAALNALFHAAGLSAPLGIHAVQGDTDLPGDDWGEVFRGLEAELYGDTRSCDREWNGARVRITGLSYYDGFDASLAVDDGADDGAFHVVLSHRPDFALSDVKADLLIAGHTHGGQVCLPFVGPLLILSAVPRAWGSGMTALSGGRTLVVSRGVGMERGRAPRLRFLCPPEVVVIDVVPGSQR